MYCLKHGRIKEAWEDAVGENPTVVLHLAANGEMQTLTELPELSEGEGVLAYSGEFYIEPLEVQVDFIKSHDARKWLEALVLRHVERVRYIPDELFVMTDIKEVDV